MIYTYLLVDGDLLLAPEGDEGLESPSPTSSKLLTLLAAFLCLLPIIYMLSSYIHTIYYHMYIYTHICIHIHSHHKGIYA